MPVKSRMMHKLPGAVMQLVAPDDPCVAGEVSVEELCRGLISQTVICARPNSDRDTTCDLDTCHVHAVSNNNL